MNFLRPAFHHRSTAVFVSVLFICGTVWLSMIEKTNASDRAELIKALQEQISKTTKAIEALEEHGIDSKSIRRNLTALRNKLENHDSKPVDEQIADAITKLSTLSQNMQQRDRVIQLAGASLAALRTTLDDIALPDDLAKARATSIRLNALLGKAGNDAPPFTTSMEPGIGALRQTLDAKYPIMLRKRISNLNAEIPDANHQALKLGQLSYARNQDLILLSKQDAAHAAASRGLAFKLLPALNKDVQGASETLRALLSAANSLLTEKDLQGTFRRSALQRDYFSSSSTATTLDNAFDDFLINWRETFTNKPVPMIVHVVRAWAGDLKAGWSSGYQCSATKALRRICLGSADEGSCGQLPEVGAASNSIDFAPLCGRDPYPGYADKNRGLAVEYACVEELRFTRQQLSENPNINPETGLKFSKNEIKTVVLRNPNATLLCAG